MGNLPDFIGDQEAITHSDPELGKMDNIANRKLSWPTPRYWANWSRERQLHIGRCDLMPSLTFADPKRIGALHGIIRFVEYGLYDNVENREVF